MDPVVWQIVIAGAVELVIAPIVVAIVIRVFGKRLDHFDDKRERARVEHAEGKRREFEQRNAEHNIVLAIARTMLLNNYEKCMDKGFYSLDEREVYSALFEQYVKSGGNGVITAIAERIRKLPTEPPDGSDD